MLPYFKEIPVLNANSVEADQMPQSTASDLHLHCLPMSLLWDARHKWIKNLGIIFMYVILFSAHIFWILRTLYSIR